jgi:FkbM family methyltransferase
MHSRSGPPEVVFAPQPWGLTIRANPREGVGRHLWDLGIMDLPVSEIIWRLLDLGEVAWDVGANIGAITSLMAVRAGNSGAVWAFEPHPVIHDELKQNVESWRASGCPLAPIRICAKALSDREGEAELFEPAEFGDNHGSASLERPTPSAGASKAEAGSSFRISTAMLDRELPADLRVGVMKMDVEGHEISVLRGASSALAEKRIRDIVFEDHCSYPSETSSILEKNGYRIFLIDRTFWRPCLLSPTGAAPSVSWLPPNYLATLDPARAAARCAPIGWQCLRGR